MAKHGKKSKAPSFNHPLPLAKGTRSPRLKLSEQAAQQTKGTKAQSQELLYESVMKSGGDPFMQSLGMGVTTLTERVARRFRKKGHFLISTYEVFNQKQRNPFTRAGASPYQGEYPDEVIEIAFDPSKRRTRSRLQRFWDWLTG